MPELLPTPPEENRPSHPNHQSLEFNYINALTLGAADADAYQFKGLVSNIPGAVYRCLCNTDWTMKYISDYVEDISGFPASDFIDSRVRSWASIILAEDQELVERTVEAAVRVQQPFIIEYRIVHRDGSIRWVYEKGRAQFDTDENLLFLDGAIFDVSDRKQAESALAKLNEELEYRVEERTAQLRSAITRLELEVQERQQIERKLRQRDRLLKGVAAANNYLLTISDHNQAIYAALAALGNATNVDRVYIFQNHWQPETSALLHSQRWEWVADGVESEMGNEALQNLSYTESFPRWLELLSRGEPVCGLVKTFPDSERKILQPQYIQSILIMPIDIDGLFWGFIGFDDCVTERNWSDSEMSILRAAAGSLGGAIARHQVHAQLRQQKHALEQTLDELQQTQMQLVQSEKMSSLGQLVAGVAHEINNPVNFIFGNLNYAKTYAQHLLHLLQLYRHHYPEPLPELKVQSEEIDLEFLIEDLPKLINSMKVGADRIQKIVASLRNFSRMDEAEMKAVDIHEGIDSTLMILQNRLKPTSDRGSIKVVKHYGPLPVVECFVGQLNQVFMNILSNAIDALDEAVHQQRDLHPTLTITTETDHEQWATVRIRDNGIGVPLEVQSKLFDPFFTTKPIGKGTGMGLSISYRIITEKHQGTLVCHSEPGEGTEFVIQIPLRQQPNSPLNK